MDNNEKEDGSIEGDVFTIEFCDGAQESFMEAISKISPVQKRTTTIATMEKLLIRLSDGKKLAAGSVVQEGNLPNGKKFKAIKKIPIRCYYWHSSTKRNVLFVSHFIYKKKDNLDKQDIAKVCNNWRDKEEK